MLGHYRTPERNRAGRRGEVYGARDEHRGRDVLGKVLPVGIRADDTPRMRFRKEALTLPKLNNPHIAAGHNCTTREGWTF